MGRPKKQNGQLWASPRGFGSKRHNINLALIKRGHSYFNNRYTWPDGFKTYALAETYAFEIKLGIWSFRKSRKHYLLRLREEGETVYYTRKSYLVSKI